MRIRHFLTLFTAVLAIGCGGGGGTPGTGGTGSTDQSTRDYVATQQPGDVWSWTLSPTTFSGTNETLNHTYSGSVEVLASGFSLLTIDSSNDGNVAVGSKAYAVEVPGTCILVRPAGGQTAMPIIGTGLGASPTTDTLSMNWITVPKTNFQIAMDDAFGVANFTKSGNGYDVAIDFGRLDYESGALEQGMGATLKDSDGRFIVVNPDGSSVNENGSDIVFGLQASGVFMADKGPGEGGIIGMVVPTNPLTWSEVAGKNYIGMLVRTGRSQLVSCKPGQVADTMDGVGLFTDDEIATGVSTDQTRGVTISLIGEISPGMFTVGLRSKDVGAPNEQMYCIAGMVDGKVIMFAFGGNQQDGTYNVFFVEK